MLDTLFTWSWSFSAFYDQQTWCKWIVGACLWGRGLLSWFLSGLAQVEMHLQLLRSTMLGVSGSGFHLVVLFCLVESFSTAGWDEYGGILLSIPSVSSSVSSYRKGITFVSPVSSRTLCSPCLCPSFTPPGMLLSFKTPNFKDSHGVDPCCLSPGMVSPASEFCWTCPRKVVAWPCRDFQFMATQNSLFSASFHAPMHGNHAAVRCYPFFLWSMGSLDHFTTWAPLSQAHSPNVADFQISYLEVIFLEEKLFS